MTAARRQGLMLDPGTYWCAVVGYADGSALLGVYGPYATKEAAEKHSVQLRAAGVHADHGWDVRPLHLIDLGTTGGGEAR